MTTHRKTATKAKTAANPYVFGFGKHNGEAVTDVPTEYLAYWFVQDALGKVKAENKQGACAAAISELKRRGEYADVKAHWEEEAKVRENSEHIGTVDGEIVIGKGKHSAATVVDILDLNSRSGYPFTIVKMRTGEGNTVTTSAKRMLPGGEDAVKVGDVVSFTARVKSHGSYNGEATTAVKSPKNIKIKPAK